MIIDEYSYAEELLASKKINQKSDLFVLAKYLRNEIHCDVNETIVMLDNILTKSDKNYNPIKWANFLKKVANKAANYNLKKVDFISISKTEIEKIDKLENPKLQRLAFTLLVYAKYNNLLSLDNNNWCNISINELYKTSKVTTRNVKEKALLLNKLKELNYISFSKKNTNLNCRFLLIDNGDEYIRVNDIRELGYLYLSFTDTKSFTICQKCGVIIKKKNKNDYSTKYCKNCQNVSRNENLLKSFHKLD